MRPELHPSADTLARRRHPLLSLACIALLAGLVQACGADSPTGPRGADPVGTGNVASVLVSVGTPGTGSLIAGSTTPVSAREVTTDGQYRTCTNPAWSSSNAAVAAVTSAGVLTGFTAGTSVISARCSGVTGSATVTVHEGAALSGTVRDEEGASLPGTTVSVMVGKYGKSAAADSGGHYRITGIVRGGSYTVSARKDGYETVSTTVPLPAAENVQDFTLPVGFAIHGRITEAGIGPLEGATVEVLSGVNAGKTSMPSTSWSGGYTIEHLLPGRFTLRASKPGYESSDRELDTSVSVTVDFTLRAAYGNCLLSVSPLTIERFASAGGDATIAVDTPPGRNWSASSDQPWIELLTGPNATGPGLVRLRIQPAQPGATDNRNAIVRVGCSASEGQNVRVSQLPDCKTTVTWAPGSPTSFPAAGGQGDVLVRTGVGGCHWQAVSRSDWITTVGVNDWYGDLEAHFVVQPNTTGAARVGTVVIGEVVWEVRQAGQ